jgi:ATP-dependent protease Clp ATPase subunit
VGEHAPAQQVLMAVVAERDVDVVPSKALDLYLATEKVIGQERVRKQMAVILDGQWRVAQGLDHSHPGGVLLGGFSGTGKTMTARAMCAHLGVPYAETDATRYAEVGYKGLQLPQMFIPLLREAARMIDEEQSPPSGVIEMEMVADDGFTPAWAPKPPKPEKEKSDTNDIFKRDDLDEVVKRAQKGVIVLDEFDKWMQRVNHFSGQSDTAIQSEFLKMIEGSHEWVTATDDEMGTAFDTSDVLIICAGAFVSLYRQVRARLHEDSDPKHQQMDENFWNAIVPEDFERFGLLPELAGRLSRHIFTRPLQAHHMKTILTQPGGVLGYYRARYEGCGARWEVSDAGVNWLVSEAMHHRTGARALDFVTHRMLGGEEMFQASASEVPVAVRLEPSWLRARIVPL